MLVNKEEIIESLKLNINKIESILEYSEGESEAVIKIIDGHGVTVCSESWDDENIENFVEVYEYAKITEHFGTTDEDELGEYKPTEHVLNLYDDLFGRYGDFDNVIIKIEISMQPYVDFQF